MTETNQQPIEQLLTSLQTGGGKLVRCRCCSAAITQSGDQINIGLSHHHLTSPEGLSFNLRCFQYAPGCALSGIPSDEASWFGGYHWQLAQCAECAEHLGWYYQRQNNRFFFGLIQDRLINKNNN
jgi:hypothetical protein